MATTVGWQGLPGFLPPEPSMNPAAARLAGMAGAGTKPARCGQHIAAVDAAEEQLLAQVIGAVAGDGTRSFSLPVPGGPVRPVTVDPSVRLLHACLAGIRDRLCVGLPQGEDSPADLAAAQELWAAACVPPVASLAAAAAARRDATIASGSSAE